MIPTKKRPAPVFPKMRKVIIETPFKGTAERSPEQHREYLKHCMADCVSRGENPYASHRWLTEVLDDADPHERGLGIKCGWEWGELADAIVVYDDMGCSPGMRESIAYYESIKKPIERRTLDFALVRSILDM